MMNSRTRKWVIFFATGAYSGYSPFASGTAGTVVGILVFIPFSLLHPVFYALALIVLTAFACWISGFAEEIFKEKDSGKIVIDEIVGYLFTMFMIPIAANAFSDFQVFCTDFVPKALVGFFLFRFFDIVKIWPARAIDQRMKNGKGVVLDDVAAGIYANWAFWLLLYLWTKFH
jgi:phosphatidylglycerophosphatase A